MKLAGRVKLQREADHIFVRKLRLICTSEIWSIWEDNIKLDIREIGCQGKKRSAFMNTVKELWIT